MYTLWNRYQDSGWELLQYVPPRTETLLILDEKLYGPFEHLGDAIIRASELAANPFAYGMIQVRDRDNNVMYQYGAGGGVK